MEVLTEFHEVILRVQVDKLIKDKREYNGRSNVFFEKNWAKNVNSGIDFRESVRKEKSLILGIRSLSHD